MTSLLGRLIPLFTGPKRVEDLFTEAVARLFDRRPELCLAWLQNLGLITAVSDNESQSYIRVTTQKSFVALDEHDSGSRPDLIVEVYHAAEDAELEGSTEVVMIESKIGSSEGEDQLKRYAGHLSDMLGTRKSLVYITRAYDPKVKNAILSGTGGIYFEQLRWHDFYRFLQTAEKDALVEEIMTFMEEQGMARSFRFSTTDLMALSGVPRAFEIFDETLDGEVKAELESFAGNKLRRETDSLWQIRYLDRYHRWASLQEQDLFCAVGWQLRKVDDSAHDSVLRIAAEGYPAAFAFLEARPGAVARATSVAAMEKIALNGDWETYNLDNPAGWAGVRRARGLTDLLLEHDHIAAVKHFFVESIRQLRTELAAFKKEHPDLPWSGG